MRRASVIPQQQIAFAPDMGINKFGLFRLIEQRIQQQLAFRRCHVHDLHGHQAVNVNRLAAGFFMRPEHRMDAFIEGFDTPVISPLR